MFVKEVTLFKDGNKKVISLDDYGDGYSINVDFEAQCITVINQRDLIVRWYNLARYDSVHLYHRV